MSTRYVPVVDHESPPLRDATANELSLRRHASGKGRNLQQHHIGL